MQYRNESGGKVWNKMELFLKYTPYIGVLHKMWFLLRLIHFGILLFDRCSFCSKQFIFIYAAYSIHICIIMPFERFWQMLIYREWDCVGCFCCCCCCRWRCRRCFYLYFCVFRVCIRFCRESIHHRINSRLSAFGHIQCVYINSLIIISCVYI